MHAQLASTLAFSVAQLAVAAMPAADAVITCEDQNRFSPYNCAGSWANLHKLVLSAAYVANVLFHTRFGIVTPGIACLRALCALTTSFWAALSKVKVVCAKVTEAKQDTRTSARIIFADCRIDFRSETHHVYNYSRTAVL